MVRLYPLGGWARRSMRIHLALLPSTQRTALSFARFRVAASGLEGRERTMARRRWLRRNKVAPVMMFRLALQELLEQRPWQVLAGIVVAAWGLGMVMGGVVRWML